MYAKVGTKISARKAHEGESIYEQIRVDRRDTEEIEEISEAKKTVESKVSRHTLGRDKGSARFKIHENAKNHRVKDR